MLLTEKGPGHPYLPMANKTSFWSGWDSKETFDKHCANPDTFNRLKQLGWDDPEAITYQYNSQGFRCPEFTEGPCGLALGCSFTMGVGLPLDKVWPSLLSQKLDIQIWNLGVGGAAMDTVFRLLDFYIDVLNPKFVAILTPPPPRFEYFDIHGSHKIALIKHERLWDPMVAPFIKTWMSSNFNIDINFKKNLLAIQQICYQHQTPLYIVKTHETQMDPMARDLTHAGVECHKAISNSFLQQIVQGTDS